VRERYRHLLSWGWRTSRRAFTTVGLIVTIVTITPVVSWWAALLAGPWNDPSGDVLIVLSGGEDAGGTMAQNTYLRSEYAIRAFQAENFRDMVVSGGGAGNRSIAESMRDYMEFRGVPATAIHVEGESRNTHENALFTKLIVEHLRGRKVLLTSDYHMTRAHLAFAKAGIEVEPRPIPDAIKAAGSWENRWGAFLHVAHETLALPYYFARGWI
jgi:uncharacterized SAM-binding protein YcdF (DUF218 family)